MSSNPPVPTPSEIAPSVPPQGSMPSAAPPPEPVPESGAMDRRILLGLAGVAGVAALSRMSKAGVLSPPAGPISPTMVSLSDINTKNGEMQASLATLSHKVAATPQGVSEPRTPIRSLPSSPTAQFVITQPGAYCLTDNIDQIPGMVCIDVQCSDVDIDCQGFVFRGPSVTPSPSSSCVRSSGQSNIELYDCSFSGWQGCCVDCNDCDDVCVSDCIFRLCSCPPGIASDGTALDGAMVRGRDRCDFEDLSISQCSGSAVVMRDSSFACRISVCDSSGRACVGRDNCCVEDFSVIGCSLTVSGNPGGSPTGLITLGAACSISTVATRVCTCPVGEYVVVLGVRCTAEDMTHTVVYGDCIFCDDHCCLCDMQFVSCTGRGIQARTGACVEDMSFHDHHGDCITCLDNCAVCDIECRACTGVAITCGAGACAEEIAISSHTGDCVRCADGSCVTEVECRSCVGLCISVGQSSLIEDCDVSGGGGGGSYRCADGSCVRRSRSHTRDASVDIAVTNRCSVEDCKVVRGQGITCGSNCCITGNELSSCVGAPDSASGMGGAIVVTGSHTSVDDNQLTDCRVAISVQSSGHYCSVDDNHVSAAVGGISGGVVAGIVIAQAAQGVLCTCNHLRVAPGATPFVPGSSSYGPLINLQPLGGDVSLVAGSAHHLANYIIS